MIMAFSTSSSSASKPLELVCPAGNLPYLVYFQGLLNYDVGGASAGGIVAVVLANIVAFFLVRMVGRNLEG